MINSITMPIPKIFKLATEKSKSLKYLGVQRIRSQVYVMLLQFGGQEAEHWLFKRHLQRSITFSLSNNQLHTMSLTQKPMCRAAVWILRQVQVYHFYVYVRYTLRLKTIQNYRTEVYQTGNSSAISWIRRRIDLLDWQMSHFTIVTFMSNKTKTQTLKRIPYDNTMKKK